MFKSVQKRVLQLNQGRAVWSHKSPPILASAASPQREITQFQKKDRKTRIFGGKFYFLTSVYLGRLIQW